MGIKSLIWRDDVYEDEYYEDGYDDGYVDSYESYQDEPAHEPSYESHGVQPIRTVADMQISGVLPKDYSECGRIADMLRDMHLVVMNISYLRENKPEDIWRILDFLSGVAYSENGHITKASDDVYIIAPYFVDLINRSMMEEDRDAEMMYY